MNEERIKEVFSDEAFVKELLSKETPEEVQELLEDKDIEMSIGEIEKAKEMILKKLEDPDAELELSDEDLEDVAGGSLLGACLILVYVVTPCVTALGIHVDNQTNGRW